MSWPEELEIELQALAQGGEAVGRWQGRPVFVAGALPGERVRVRLVEHSSALARGQLLEVLEAAPGRRSPPCPLYGRCGGCDWQQLDEQTQLAGKAQILRDQLVHMGRIPNPASVSPLAGAAWGYRAVARLHVEGDRLGFYASGSHRVVALERCPLLHPLINQAITALAPLLPIAGLRELTLRASVSEGRLVALCSGAEPAALAAAARRWRAALPELEGVASATRHSWQPVDGRPYLYERFGGLRLRISPTSFFQANPALAEQALEALAQALQLQPGEQLLDAYCGIGTLLLPLALRASLGDACGIEEHPAAIEDARWSAAQAGLERVRLLAGRVEQLLPQLGQRFDAVVLDPPRRGLAPEALRALLALRPTRIAYLSCHPGTLARDLRALVEAGYQLRSSRAFDFFPQTSHVESLSVLDVDR